MDSKLIEMAKEYFDVYNDGDVIDADKLISLGYDMARRIESLHFNKGG